MLTVENGPSDIGPEKEDSYRIPEVKEGKKTTELWVTAGGAIISILATFKVISVDFASELGQKLPAAVFGAAAIASLAAMIWKYIDSREKVKNNQLMLHHHQMSLISDEKIAKYTQSLNIQHPEDDPDEDFYKN